MSAVLRCLLLALVALSCTSFALGAPCTAYQRQDNCVGNPPLRADPLPPCAGFDGPLPANVSAFAVVGDFGLDGACMSQVAALVLKAEKQFGHLEFVMTTGDNAYWTGTCDNLATGVGKYYSSFLPNATLPSCTTPAVRKPLGWTNPNIPEMQEFNAYQKMLRQKQMLGADVDPEPRREQSVREAVSRAVREAGSASPARFWPSLGNHDWTTFDTSPFKHMPYFQYFPYLLPQEPALGNGQFYVRTVLPGVEIYSLNSNLGNPKSPPAQNAMHKQMVMWLEEAVRSSTAPFKIVYFHHPPWGTAEHDALSPWMDLPYEEWGVSLVLAGHEHVYERMQISRPGREKSLPFIVNGMGGHPWTYTIHDCPPAAGSLVRYNSYHGMQLGLKSWDEQAQTEKIDFCFYTLEKGGSLVDHFELKAGGN